jgi:3-methyl-2-oxobutanoate hydroxymethyltransferase
MNKALSLPELIAMKQAGRKIVSLTAYDASFSRLLDEAGVDVVLVGDSLGMVVQGQKTTLPVSLDDMIYHTRCVARGIDRAVLVADLPFMSYARPEQAAESAAQLIRAGARMVKLEGGRQRVGIVNYLVDNNIPVCAHLGLLPQSIHRLGGYYVQGRDEAAARALTEDAKLLQDAGAGMLVLECIPAALAAEITRALSIPTIGIGAGAACDGQVLVLYDLLGITAGKRPKFSKNFLAGAEDVRAAVKAYAAAVRAGDFPADEHSYR